MTTHLPSRAGRSGATLEHFLDLEDRVRRWALEQGGDEHVFPVLLESETLQRAGYPEAFPHLLMSAAVAADPAEPLDDENTRLAGWCLSPAVCYHAYAALAGETLTAGREITASGHCFRHEEASELLPGRRQIEFTMRELILIGEPDWIAGRLAHLQPEVEALAQSCGLNDLAWHPANDPFFLPRARGKAHMQRLLGTKIELCLPDGLALASINRHGSFFGERFAIHTADRAPAHSACIAFGLDRWAALPLETL